jgi:hypothetical protein
MGHKLVGAAFQDRLIDQGLSKDWLEHGHPELNVDGFCNREGLWDGYLIRAVGSDKEQKGSEHDRAQADTHYDVDGTIAVRHTRLLSASGSSARGKRIAPHLARVT